jgi:hypothetical protein
MSSTPDEHQPEHPGQPAAPAEPGPAGDLAGGWGSDGALTGEQIAELTGRDWDPAEAEDPRWADDPETGPPSWWLALPGSEQARLLAESEPCGVAEAFEAGFTHGLGGNGNGFAGGGPLDVMLPGSDLGWHVGQAMRRPLGAYSDDELFGLLCASRRQRSLGAAVEYKLVAELDRRRAGDDGTPGEHVSQELAAGLTLTNWSASGLLAQARELRRLPGTMDLLASGIIDERRAQLIARHTAVLSPGNAAAVEDLILPRAAAMTTGELGSACLRAVLKADPQAARNRKDSALRQARVEAWFEESGTVSLAGRDLPPAEGITADRYLDEAARWLSRHGADGTHQQLRATAFTCLLRGQPLDSLLPGPAPAAQPATSQTSNPAAAGNPDPDADTPDPEPARPDPEPASGRPGSGQAGNPQPGVLGGSVHLVMLYDTWAGRGEDPGEIAGLGAADAPTCRDLAAQMTTAGPATRWCITLTDRDGRAVAHGCARAGPGPPGPGADPHSWLATVTIHPVETSTCQHRRQSAGYQPSHSLRHIVKIRSPRCGFPGCRRPAIRCDDDHSIPYHLGGRTCECNLYPLCRMHHRCKQAPGWHLEQPQPGSLLWTSPSGRTYPKITEPYPV